MDAIANLAVNTIRTLSLDAVQKANSGHPGLPMGSAPMAYVLYQKHLKHNPKNPRWADRDRFVLSGGHGSMLVYSMLHLTGYDVTLDDLKSFRQWGSRTPGHPESFMTPGVEATTGPLGQGTANAVGMAMAERFLANRYNKPGHTIVDHYTYALVSDGDLMEGISHEAASLAGHLKLGKLIYLYDDNLISLDGPTSLSFTEDVGKRYESYGWQVLRVTDGNGDLDGIDKAIAAARADTGRPSIIMVRTTIGFGSPNKANTHEAHGSPLGAEEVKATKKNLGFDPDKHFFIPEEAAAHLRAGVDGGARAEAEWLQRFERWAAENAELASEWRSAQAGDLPQGWESAIPTFTPKDELATRESGGKVITALAAKVPYLFGGDADLSVSTKTGLKGLGNFDGQTGAGRNIRFGVREHAMGAIANGMAYHGGIRPFTATFFCFADYERPALRLAAPSLRAMPNMWVIRPGDANETAEAWRMALERRSGPCCIVLSRQSVPTYDRQKVAPSAEARKGGYVLSDAPGGAPQAILIATGSELPIAVQAQTQLAAAGVRARVVSLPCWEAFAAQPKEYRDAVLPPSVTARVSIEAGATFGWQRWVGDKGVSLGLDRFGASAPYATIYKELGLTAENLAKTVQSLL
jgi:transketolase